MISPYPTSKRLILCVSIIQRFCVTNRRCRKGPDTRLHRRIKHLIIADLCSRNHGGQDKHAGFSPKVINSRSQPSPRGSFARWSLRRYVSQKNTR
jgi:hypothetical protein